MEKINFFLLLTQVFFLTAATVGEFVLVRQRGWAGLHTAVANPLISNFAGVLIVAFVLYCAGPAIFYFGVNPVVYDLPRYIDSPILMGMLVTTVTAVAFLLLLHLTWLPVLGVRYLAGRYLELDFSHYPTNFSVAMSFATTAWLVSGVVLAVFITYFFGHAILRWISS